jgi:hypothetical protein
MGWKKDMVGYKIQFAFCSLPCPVHFEQKKDLTPYKIKQGTLQGREGE